MFDAAYGSTCTPAHQARFRDFSQSEKYRAPADPKKMHSLASIPPCEIFRDRAWMVGSARRSIARRAPDIVQSRAQLHQSQRGVARLRIAQPIRYVGGEMEISFATAASLEVERDERLIRRAWWHMVPLILLTYLVSAIDRMNVRFAKLQMVDQIGLLALMLTPIVLFCTALAIQITDAGAPVNRSAS
jgi:hypothetical protein